MTAPDHSRRPTPQAPTKGADGPPSNRPLPATQNRLRKRLERTEAVNRTLSALLANTRFPTVLLDHEGRICLHTPAAEKLISVTADDIGRRLAELPHRFTTNDLGQVIEAVLSSGKSQDADVQTDEGRWYVRHVGPTTPDNHTASGVIVTFSDVTTLKHGDQTLLLSERRFRTLYHDNPSICFIVDRSGVIQSVNRFGAEQLGYAINELEGTSFTKLGPTSASAAGHKLLQCFNAPESVQRWETELPRRDGSTLWTRVSAHVVAHADATPAALICCEDISAEKQLEQELSHRATHDDMTGLANRQQFEMRLEMLARNTNSDGIGHVLLFLDLDRFKVINDTLGHQAGDELLRQIARLMVSQVRQQDLVARLGGDEFAVLLENCGYEDGLQLAQLLLKTLKRFHCDWQGHRLSAGVSIGMLPITGSESDLATLLQAADHACYIAKAAGRNRVHVYDEKDPAVRQRQSSMDWMLRVDAAVDHHQVELYCQTIAPLRRTHTANAQSEILLRLVDDASRQAPAADFIPVTERFRQSSHVDRWVLSSALRWLTQHPDSLAAVDRYMINLSTHSLSDHDFVDFIIDALRNHDVPAAKLCFKITETAATSDIERTEQLIQSLRALGCGFALDEFGNNLSSFNDLQRLTVDFIKIKRDFVTDAGTNGTHRAMVRWINEITQMMGIRTIADGVESALTLDTVRMLGVDFAQGHVVGQPQRLSQ